MESLCQINNSEFGPFRARAFFQLDAVSLPFLCEQGSFPEGRTGRIYPVFCFLTCLTLCSDSIDVLSPWGAPEHKRGGKEHSREGMKVFRGLSLFLELNGLVRERILRTAR